MKLIRFVFIVFLSLLFTPLYAQENDTTNYFEMSLEELMQMEVYSATKRSEPITNIPASIIVISRKEIQENGWQTLEEILTHVPGMYMINDYLWFGTDNFGVRGFFSTGSFNTMIVKVNGVTQKEDWYNSFPFTKINVPVEAIDKIEVIRGPMSVVYGNNAFLGAINIITNESGGNSVQANGGSNGDYKAFARIAQKSENFSYNINVGLYGSNGIDAPYSEMLTNQQDIAAWNLPLNATSGGQLEDHRKYIITSFKFNSFYFESANTLTNKGVVDFYPGFDDGHIAVIQASNSVLGYKKDLSETTNINVKLGYYSFSNRLDYKHNSDTTAYTFNDIYSEAFDAEVNLNFHPFSNLNTSFGVYYRYIFSDHLVVDAPNLSSGYINLDAGLGRGDYKTNWAVFSQATYTFFERLHLIGGIRLEQTPKYDISYAVRFDPQNNSVNYLARKGTYQFDDILVIPRAALLFNITDIHHIKLMYGMAVREPSIGENMDVVRYPDRPQLKPAYMQTIELNYVGLVTSFASINFSIFQNNVNNLISRTNSLQNGVVQIYNTNSGKLQTLGTELSILIKPGTKFSSNLSLTYQNSKNLQDGYEDIDLEYAPQLLAYISTSYKFYKQHTIAFSGYYIDKMETFWKVPGTSVIPSDGARIGEQSPAYFIGNLNLRFNNLLNKGVYCYAYVYNILDTEIIYPTTRSNDQFNIGTIGNSRNVSVGLGIQF